MSDYYCNTCKCSFTRKYSYDVHCLSFKHLERLRKKNTHICTCGKQYLHQPSLSKHKKTCKVIQESKRNTSDTEIIQKQLSDLLEKYEHLSSIIIANATANTNTNTTTNYNNSTHIDTQNNNISIQINAFGNENLDYITDGGFDHCVNRVYASIPTLIEKVHFDPAHPENHNIKIPNKKQPHASVLSENKEWKLMDKNEVIANMMDTGYILLDDRFRENKANYTEYRQKQYRQYQEKYDNEDKETIKRIKSDVEYVILNGTKRCHS